MGIPVESWKWYGDVDSYKSGACEGGVAVKTRIGDFVVDTWERLNDDYKDDFVTGVYRYVRSCACGCGTPVYTGGGLLRVVAYKDKSRVRKGHENICRWVASEAGQRRLIGMEKQLYSRLQDDFEKVKRKMGESR